MFTFRRLTIIFFLFLLGFNLVSLFGCGLGETFFCMNLPWFYAGLLIAYFGISVAMAFLPCSGFHMPVICRGETDRKVLAITFDDGPDPQKTPVLLDLLKKHKVPATFFLIGRNIQGNEELVKRMHAEGHLTGTHSWSHSYWFDFFPSLVMRRELVRNREAIKKVTGRSPLMFRPPYGVVNPMLAGALRKLPLDVIGWSIRSYDTIQRDPQRVMKRVLSSLMSGAIILLHDKSLFTTSVLEELITRIAAEGYRIIPLDELLKIKAYED
jgi:peptidoglycan/xylan/chitin deacetylase (PgdA/CDA1 family)